MRAIVKTQKALKADPSLSTAIAERLFPPEEVPLIAGLIARDAPFYDAAHFTRGSRGLEQVRHGERAHRLSRSLTNKWWRRNSVSFGTDSVATTRAALQKGHLTKK